MVCCETIQKNRHIFPVSLTACASLTKNIKKIVEIVNEIV